jgi:uroporphyrinogen-III synthase
MILQSHRQPVNTPAAVATTQPIAAKAKETPVNRYQPVQASSVLYDLKEDGTAYLPDQTEGRQVRYRYVDTYTWKNPATNASLRWSVPRDEVRLVRASLD